ncbi:hypothetical protein ACFQYP_15415 [Nonomuraea antimicrobica]
MADVQDDVREELTWDLRALAAADLVTDERVARAGVTLSVKCWKGCRPRGLATVRRTRYGPRRAAYRPRGERSSARVRPEAYPARGTGSGYAGIWCYWAMEER